MHDFSLAKRLDPCRTLPHTIFVLLPLSPRSVSPSAPHLLIVRLHGLGVRQTGRLGRWGGWHRAAGPRLPPEGTLGADTSINLQETSVPRLLHSSSSLSRPVLSLIFPRRRKAILSPEQNSQITNTCIFPSLLHFNMPPISVSLSQSSIYLSVLVFVFSLNLFLFLSLMLGHKLCSFLFV